MAGGPTVSSVVVDRIAAKIRAAENDYHRLVLVVSREPTATAEALRKAADRFGVQPVNVNLEVSRRLMDVPVDQRAVRFARVLEEVAARAGSPVFLHRTAMIFDPALQQDPVRLLKHLSRARTIVAAWEGRVEAGLLTYAEPGHAEYRRHSVDGLTLVETG